MKLPVAPLIALSIFLSLLSGYAEAPVVKYEGVYRSEKISHNGETLWKYLRFYPNGKVISVTSTGAPADLKAWFNDESPNVSYGVVTLHDDVISFNSEDKYGNVAYSGKMEGGKLKLKWLSQINQANGDHTFTFVEW